MEENIAKQEIFVHAHVCAKKHIILNNKKDNAKKAGGKPNSSSPSRKVTTIITDTCKR